MKRIHVHWTAGNYDVSSADKRHYHFIIDGTGRIHAGIYKPEDNESTADGKYAAHTLGANTGAIGVAIAAMRQAIEHPFESGPCPILKVQWDSMVSLVAELRRKYHIEISPSTILTHAEVQGTLGIKQRGKWDITRIPFRPDLIGAKACGDFLRACVGQH